MYVQALGTIALAAISLVSAQSPSGTPPASSTSGSILAVSSPTWMPKFALPSGAATSYPTGQLDTSASLSKQTLNASAYPEPWASPPTNHPEVQAVIKALDWTHVPNAPASKADKNGDITFGSYNADTDPYCWWSDTNCVKPKAAYLPEDIYYCPRAGDWGLTYDDGPYNYADDDPELNKYAEPVLYNFLANHNNQKATLFYIGSNVMTYPAAALRGINDGHVICVHTWSHPAMTTQTNDQVVAELYWTLRAIKESTGVTPKCWRPPFGDVDDRVRAIAWQMGLRTIIWDEDTNDWNMPGDGGGNLSPSTVDGYFEGWINARKNGTDTKQGHIVLEHELNNATVQMAQKWLPTLQETFNVVTVQACMNISQPYWEENWVYPTEDHNTTTSTSSQASPSGTPQSQSSTSANKSTVNASQQQSSGVTSTSTNVMSVALAAVAAAFHL